MATYLQRTGSGAYYGKMTISFWVKRSKLGEQGIFTRREGSATANLSTCHFTSADQLLINFRDGGGTSKYYMITNRVFRDVGAWYHIVFAIDGTHATASERSKLYINGVRETSFSLLSNPSSTGYEVNMFVGGSYPTYVARGLRSQTDGYLTFEGCMSHFHCSTGYTYDADIFGEIDSTTGEWKIKTAPTFTPGTDGFTILKDGMTITDQSSNSNNFTLSTGTLTKTEDNPSNVFATMNPLASWRGQNNTPQAVLANGNLKTGIGSSEKVLLSSTIGASTGKWYWEAKSDGVSKMFFGICNSKALGDSNAPHSSSEFNGIYYYEADPYYAYAGSQNSSNIASISSGDILNFAMDCDNSTFYIGKNGVYMNGGVPTSGATGTGSINRLFNYAGSLFYDGGVQTEMFPSCYVSSTSGSGTASFNFGNGYFGTTAVSSAGTNASGNGIFEYDVPTGYTALSTKGLNL